MIMVYWLFFCGVYFFIIVTDVFCHVGAVGWGSGGSFLCGSVGKVEALFWNPAGLAYLRQREILSSNVLSNNIGSTSYTQAYAFGLKLPEDIANIAIGYLKNPKDKDGYIHEQLILGVGGVGSGIFKDIAMGLSLRRHRIEYYRNSSYIGNAKVELVNVGLLYKFAQVIFGILVKNFNSQSVEFTDGSRYKFARKIDCGLMYGKDNLLFFIQLWDFTKKYTLLSFGSEYRPFNNFAIRVGRHAGEYDTFGVGYSLNVPAFKYNVSIDYALKFSKQLSIHICDLHISF